MKIDTKVRILFDDGDPEDYILVAVGEDDLGRKLFAFCDVHSFNVITKIDDEGGTDEEKADKQFKLIPEYEPFIVPCELIWDNVLAEIEEENLVIVNLKGVKPDKYMKPKENEAES
jgi:hypothetical protein